MKTIFLAVLLSVMQAAPPVPRQTANEPAGSGNNVQNKTDSDKSNSAMAKPIQPSASSTENQSSRQQPSSNNAGESVSVRELPTVSVNADWWNRFYVIFTGLLVGIGGLGAQLARRTLNAIERQSKANEEQLAEIRAAGQQTARMIEHAETQAQSTKASADALINIERAWVMAEIGWWEKKPHAIVQSVENGKNHTTVFVKLTCRNEGKSPAWIDNVYGWISIVRGGELVDIVEERQGGSHAHIGPLGVGKERSITVELRTAGHMGEGQFLNATLSVEYHDVFGIPRETLLGYSIDSGNIYRQDALPNRNRNT